MTPAIPSRPHVIVFGNEKGGSGKSTMAMHVAVALLRSGLRVAAIDTDARQASLTQYFRNREKRASQPGAALPCPTHFAIQRAGHDMRAEAEADEALRFNQAMTEARASHDIIVIDTPGSDNFLSRYAHSHADTLVTPLNDSFVDFSLLAQIDPDNHDIVRPNIYAEMVWDQRKKRVLRDKGSIDWIVLRNRLSSLDSRNRRDMGEAIDHLAKRIGFRVAPGFTERVIFRELYLKGLTVMDMMDSDAPLTLSHIAARQEVRSLLEALNIPALRTAATNNDAQKVA